MDMDSVRVLTLARDLYDHLEDNPLSLSETNRAIEIAKWWAYVEHSERVNPILLTPSQVLFPLSRVQIQRLGKTPLQDSQRHGECLLREDRSVGNEQSADAS